MSPVTHKSSFLWPTATTMSYSSFYWGLPNKISLKGPVSLGGLCENKKRDQHIRVLNCLIDCLWSVLLQIYWDNLLFGQLFAIIIFIHLVWDAFILFYGQNWWLQGVALPYNISGKHYRSCAPISSSSLHLIGPICNHQTPSKITPFSHFRLQILGRFLNKPLFEPPSQEFHLLINKQQNLGSAKESFTPW